jgi:endonuclease-3
MAANDRKPAGSVDSRPKDQAGREAQVETLKPRMAEIVRRLRAAYPGARCSLDFANPFQLLVATILSAQCTDERVNMVTPGLFAAYPCPEAFVAASRGELENAVHSTGFYHRKAEYIQRTSGHLVAEHGGEVPAEMEALLRLPGVSRKTANVVLGNAFAMAEGIVVDTHVSRLAGRLGLSSAADPAKIERDLLAITKRDDWIDLAHLFIYHGRRTCQARRPDCAHCVLADLCPSAVA